MQRQTRVAAVDVDVFVPGTSRRVGGLMSRGAENANPPAPPFEGVWEEAQNGR